MQEHEDQRLLNIVLPHDINALICLPFCLVLHEDIIYIYVMDDGEPENGFL